MIESSLVGLLEVAGKLKRLRRTGWLEHGIPDSESVADHSFSVAFMAMVLGSYQGLDVSRCIQLALIHDMAEAEVGDIVSSRNGVPVRGLEQKEDLESAAAASIFSIEGGEVFLALFTEYQAGKTAEAKFVKQLDKLDMALTALDYEVLTQKDLSEFFNSAALGIHENDLLELFNTIKSLRP